MSTNMLGIRSARIEPRRPRALRADLDVAVMGVGPHGLSATVHLRRAGIAAHAFGEAMSFWQSMPNGMSLRSNMSATNMIEPKGPLSLVNYMAERASASAIPCPCDDSLSMAYGCSAKPSPTWTRVESLASIVPRVYSSSTSMTASV